MCDDFKKLNAKLKNNNKTYWANIFKVKKLTHVAI